MKTILFAVAFMVVAFSAHSANAVQLGSHLPVHACPAWGCGPAPIRPINPQPPICIEPRVEPLFVCPRNALCARPRPCSHFLVPLAHGIYSSNEARMVVDANGATIEFGCATGKINGQIFLGAYGPADSFVHSGTIQANLPVQQIGPDGRLIVPAPQSVTYFGMVRGDVLDLTVQGHTYVLEYGSTRAPFLCE